jgi:hypothetical protein
MKYKTLFTAHLCEETGAVIIDPAVNQEVRVLPTIKTSPFEPEKSSEPDYSRLIGKWVKCIYVELGKNGLGKWFKVVGASKMFKDSIVIEHSQGVDGFNVKHFDLTDPRDTNPDEEERVIPFDIERWRSGNYVRVQTRGGELVKQLVAFEIEDGCPRLFGVVGKYVFNWLSSGRHINEDIEMADDLTLVIKGGAE